MSDPQCHTTSPRAHLTALSAPRKGQLSLPMPGQSWPLGACVPDPESSLGTHTPCPGAPCPGPNILPSCPAQPLPRSSTRSPALAHKPSSPHRVLTLLAESWDSLKENRAPLLLSSSSHFPLNHLMAGLSGSSFPFNLAKITASFPGWGWRGGREWPGRSHKTLRRGLGSRETPAPPPSDPGAQPPRDPPRGTPHQSPPTQRLASSGKCRWAPQWWETGPQVGLLLRGQD